MNNGSDILGRLRKTSSEQSLFNFEGPKLSLEARPAGENRQESAFKWRDSLKRLPESV